MKAAEKSAVLGQLYFADIFATWHREDNALDNLNHHGLELTAEQKNSLKLRGVLQPLVCDSSICGGKVIGQTTCFKLENGNIIAAYPPSGGFVVADEERKDYCNECAEKLGVTLFRSASEADPKLFGDFDIVRPQDSSFYSFY